MMGRKRRLRPRTRSVGRIAETVRLTEQSAVSRSYADGIQRTDRLTGPIAAALLADNATTAQTASVTLRDVTQGDKGQEQVFTLIIRDAREHRKKLDAVARWEGARVNAKTGLHYSVVQQGEDRIDDKGKPYGTLYVSVAPYDVAVRLIPQWFVLGYVLSDRQVCPGTGAFSPVPPEVKAKRKAEKERKANEAAGRGFLPLPEKRKLAEWRKAMIRHTIRRATGKE